MQNYKLKPRLSFCLLAALATVPRPMIIIMFIVLLALLSFPCQAILPLHMVEPQVFTFPSFDPDSCGRDGDLICWDSAAPSDLGHMDLTPRLSNDTHDASSIVNNGGRFLYRHPILAWPASFTTTFVVRISRNPNSSLDGDGMAFVMAEDSGPNPANSSGLFMGIFNGTTQGGGTGMRRIFAVELDTFMNDFDPDSNHVGVNTWSIMSDATANLDSAGVDLKQGRLVKIKIKYDGWSKILQVFAASGSANLLVSVLNHSVVLETLLCQSVFVGFAASSAGFLDNHQVVSWAFTSFPLPHNSLQTGRRGGGNNKKTLVIAIPVVAGLLGLGCSCVAVGRTKWRERSAKKARRDGIRSRSRDAVDAPKMFTFQELSMATKNFSRENLLGVGGFGSVYRGDIKQSPFTIAVKRISATSSEGEREYFAEICTIGRLRHKNLVQLIGWCHKRQNHLLVYEFMPNGSLDRLVAHGFLDWATRNKVLTGLASALLYLHEECGKTVIHRDVKPSNVMLDTHYNARLGDFGLARLVENANQITTKLAGTPGYMAPECSYTGKATTDSDVFSFGIVALEVACGRRSVCGEEEGCLVDRIWELYESGDLLHGADPRLELKGELEEQQMKRVLTVGLACSHPDPRTRPTMQKVVQIFKNPEEALMELPESRPAAIYVPLLSPAVSGKAFGSNANTSSAVSEVSMGETSLQYGR